MRFQNTLILKLMASFLLVIFVGALLIYFLTTSATQNAFRLYTTQNGQIWAERLAPEYAAYYARSGSWQGIETLIELDTAPLSMSEMMNRGAGNGRNQGGGMGMASGWMGGVGQRLILADDSGAVLVDTANELTGLQLSSEELASGAPILVGEDQVGTLIIAPADTGSLPNPASTFLGSVNRSILISVLIAGVVSLVLVLIFSLQITAPIRQMQKVASAVAQGDLSQRVTVRSQDELGDLAQTFNRMTTSLADAEGKRHQLLADIAHELRTPMAVIQASAEAIQDGVLPFEMSQVNTIHHETLLLGRLIDDLRLISLAEAGELQLEKRETDLVALLQQSVDRTLPLSQQKGITLNLSIGEPLPPAEVDADRIAQVFNNLVSNSLRYTPPGGTIAIEARRSGSDILIQVTDTGPGIPAADLPYVFDRFYRADKSRARGSGGSGLGLAIAKQLVEAHGGSISAASPIITTSSQAPHGTQITVTIPVKV